MKFCDFKNSILKLSSTNTYNYKLSVKHACSLVQVICDKCLLYSVSERYVGCFISTVDVISIPEDLRLALQKVIYKYSRTPICERYLRFRVRMMPGEYNFDTYLNRDRSSRHLFLSERDEDDDNQVIFMKSEYEKLQQKYPEWLPKFDDTDPHFELLEDEE